MDKPMMGAPSRTGADVMATAESRQQAQSEIHRCDRCGERTRHMVVLVPRDHSRDILPKDKSRTFWQIFRASLLTNAAFGANLAYLDPNVRHLICERCGETFLEY